jgi:hypothetical protein
MRALAALVMLAAAAALLLAVPDVGSGEGGAVWGRAGVLAAAGVLVGLALRGRLPGTRPDVLLLILAVLPWTLLALAVCAVRAGTPVWLSDLVHDLLPESVLRRWSVSFPVMPFVEGALLAVALTGTARLRARERPAVVRDDRHLGDDPDVRDDPELRGDRELRDGRPVAPTETVETRRA